MAIQTEDRVTSIEPQGEPARTKYQPAEPSVDELSALIWADIERVSGAPCFRGTRVPVQILFDHLAEGQLDEFFEDFPGVSRETVVAVIDLSAKALLSRAFRR